MCGFKGQKGVDPDAPPSPVGTADISWGIVALLVDGGKSLIVFTIWSD